MPATKSYHEADQDRQISRSRFCHAEQLRLGIDYAPPKVRRHGLRDAHTYPLVSRGKRNGLPWASWRMPASDAWRFPEIELRAGNSWPALILDLDGAHALERLVYAADRGDVLQPNWIVTRRRGGGTHAVWNLQVPVHRGPGTKARPMKALARIAEYYADTLDADRGYQAVLTHNPMARTARWGKVDGKWCLLVSPIWRLKTGDEVSVDRQGAARRLMILGEFVRNTGPDKNSKRNRKDAFRPFGTELNR